MKKARLIAGMTAAIPALGAFAAPAAAHATTASPHQVKGKTVLLQGIRQETKGPQWASLSESEIFHPRTGNPTKVPKGYPCLRYLLLQRQYGV
jgi:hypothetical protein